MQLLVLGPVQLLVSALVPGLVLGHRVQLFALVLGPAGWTRPVEAGSCSARRGGPVLGPARRSLTAAWCSAWRSYSRSRSLGPARRSLTAAWCSAWRSL